MSKIDLLERAETSPMQRLVSTPYTLLDEMERYLAIIGHTEQFERWLERRPAYLELTQVLEEVLKEDN